MSFCSWGEGGFQACITGHMTRGLHPGGDLHPGGGLHPGGCLLEGGISQTPSEIRKAGGMHSTGMLSCFLRLLILVLVARTESP